MLDGFRVSSSSLPEAVPCGSGYAPVVARAGDSCWSISQDYGMTLEDLVQANEGRSLECERLGVGEEVCVAKSE